MVLLLHREITRCVERAEETLELSYKIPVPNSLFLPVVCDWRRVQASSTFKPLNTSVQLTLLTTLFNFTNFALLK